MRLAKLTEFRNLFYTPHSAPAMSTLRAQIDREEIPGGCKRGRRYYVDLDEFDRVNGLHDGLMEGQEEAAKDPLLAGLI